MISAIIVAAGSGTRMGAKVDKLFLEVAGRPVIAHTWGRFDSKHFDEIVLVVRDGQQQAFNELAAQFKFRTPFRVVAGGKERQDSVWNGLEALSPRSKVVAIHDGARPCTSPALIRQVIDAVNSPLISPVAAVAATRLSDTVKRSGDGMFISEHLDRSKLWTVQTPQCFRVEVIKRALAMVRERGMHVTDDTAACDLIGHPVMLVESNAPNPKVTVPEDLPYIEFLLRSEAEQKVR